MVRSHQIVALDQALDELERLDPDLATLVNLRFFAELELEEIAVLLERSERSLNRDWRKARAFLKDVLGDDMAKG